ncbi:MAG: transcription termination/antitermination factor NusG [Clostridia bacterium]|nr:transcription termination/antitermination factor NusG [Clostridia bacterium]
MSDFSNEITEPHWYVAHTYSGYENKVKTNLEKIVENRSLQHLIMDVRIPVEITVENEGEENEKQIESKVFPSYVLIKMVMTDESWHVVRNITGVTGFVGPGSKPVPLTDEEVEAIGIEEVKVNLKYDVGDTVKIVSGALTGFTGVVREISEDKKTIKVIASMFGRETPVELNANEVEPIE